MHDSGRDRSMMVYGLYVLRRNMKEYIREDSRHGIQNETAEGTLNIFKPDSFVEFVQQ